MTGFFMTMTHVTVTTNECRLSQNDCTAVVANWTQSRRSGGLFFVNSAITIYLILMIMDLVVESI